AAPSQESAPDPSPAGNFDSASARRLPSGGAGGGFGAEQVHTEDERPGQTTPPPHSRLEAKIVAASFAAHLEEIQITALEPSWLVIAQNNYHCWRASSDGDPLYLWKANYAFQAALVPAGRHLVQLVYRDSGFAA